MLFAQQEIDFGGLFCIAVVSGIYLGFIGAIIGYFKGRAGPGCLWGIVLGPIGCLIIASYGDIRPRCPACRKIVDGEAQLCPYCRSDLSAYQNSRMKADFERQQREDLGTWIRGLFAKREVVPTLSQKSIPSPVKPTMIGGKASCPDCKNVLLVSTEMGRDVYTCPSCGKIIG
jgi:predicted RNA-binding Zn-ribbon protein involved in translation (DUF1610 family)